MKLIRLSLLLTLAVASSACNVFSPFDKPSGDVQLLSAARACFDRGDFACASENYGKLSSDSAATATAEQVYLTIDQQGATMGAFATFVGNGANGQALTIFAETMASGAGQDKRMKIFNALASIPSYSSPASATTDVQKFSIFVASLALTGEILGEIAVGNGGTLRKADITNSSGVMKLSSNAFTAAGFNTASPSSDQLYWALQNTQAALNTLQPGGNFSGTSSGFGTIIGSGQPNLNVGVDLAFRQGLTLTSPTGFNVGR